MRKATIKLIDDVGWRISCIFFHVFHWFIWCLDWKRFCRLNTDGFYDPTNTANRRVHVAVDIESLRRGKCRLCSCVMVSPNSPISKVDLEIKTPIKPKSLIIASSTNEKTSWHIHQHYTEDLHRGTTHCTIFLNY